MPETLTKAQILHYTEDGYLVLENRIPADRLARIRDENARFEEEARGLTASNDRLDPEDSHTAQSPRPRRIKLPHLSALTRWEGIAESDTRMLCGRPTLEPRLKHIPQPQPDKPPFIYEIQKGLKSRSFDTFSKKETIS